LGIEIESERTINPRLVCALLERSEVDLAAVIEGRGEEHLLEVYKSYALNTVAVDIGLSLRAFIHDVVDDSELLFLG
jgi:hypothetical protein